jgi:tetratricopeptide (TPR) repeat protein
VEWVELLNQFQQNIKLSVVAKGQDAFFKDGPKPEFVKAYAEGTQTEYEISMLHGLEDRVVRALESLFPSKKILPYNLPSFLSGALSFQTLGERVGNLDINVAHLQQTLHREALRLMESPEAKSLLEAKNLLLSLLHLQPEDPVTLYNLACADSLIGNISSALSYLRQSIHQGYNNLVHMCQDPDLAALRGLEEWHNLVALLKEKLGAAQPKVPKVEEPKVESPKVEAPKVEPPKVEPPKVEPPKVEPPKVEAPKVVPAPKFANE